MPPAADALPPDDARRPDLDWLRVVAILLLHLFHTGMFFNTWEWHVKSPVPLPELEPVMEVLHAVRMPLLMLVAGVGTAFALRRRTLGAFTKDRLLRLFVPLLFGIFVVVPPQIWAERLFRGEFHGGYADFYPSVFGFVPYPEGSFSWHHLWFVFYLLAYSLLALPLFAALRTGRGQAFLARADGWLSRGWNVAWLALPLGLGRWWLGEYPETHAFFDDPRTVLYYGQLFLFGHLMGRGRRVWEHLVARRRQWLAATAAVLALMLPDFEYPQPFESLGVQAFAWGFILTALAWARHLVTRPRPWLAWAQERAYPFYILHQTVIVLVAFALLRAPVGPWTLFAAVLGLSFTLTLAGTEVAARVPLLRPLFGMKPARPRGPRQAAAAPAAPGAGHTG
jgi:peptidoglycan/LPS O-acetylase OafA/YrhL